MSFVYIVKKDLAFDIKKATKSVEENTGISLKALATKELHGHVGALFTTDNDNAHELCKKAVTEGKFDFDVFAATSFPTLKEKGEICLDMDTRKVND